MKMLVCFIVLFAFTGTSCHSQSQYFHPANIIDKTKELSGKNVWTSLNDKECIDGYTMIGDSIFGGEINCNIKPLKDINTRSFKVMAGTKYAKDTNHVYYPLETFCHDYIDCGVCYYAKIIIENADPATFKYLDKDYATDGKLVFFRGLLIPGADGASFKVIDGPKYFYFATDKRSVYQKDKIFTGADAASFRYYPNDPRNKVSDFESTYIVGDKNNIWEFIPPNQVTKVERK